MVFVKVRETYDLHTTKNKMTVIGIHTPKPDIIKKSYPGLLMQCRAYRPVSADVRVACASVLPLDPQGVGLAEGDVAPEDVFNPILYKAMSNKGMSQLEARINGLSIDSPSNFDVAGSSADVEVDSFTDQADEFNVYYGLLANTHDWKHSNPQSGLSMKGLRPLVYEMVYNVGDNSHQWGGVSGNSQFSYPAVNGNKTSSSPRAILGKAKPMPFIPCTSFSLDGMSKEGGEKVASNYAPAGFENVSPFNASIDIPYLHVVCGCIIVPPSRLHELFYRMVVEWTIEFSSIRPLGEITDWLGLASIGNNTHLQNYSYEATKEAVTGTKDSILSDDSCMVSANVEVKKVM